MHENLGGWGSGAAKPLFACEDGHLGALEWGSAPTHRAALEPHLRVAQRSGCRETPRHNHGWLSFVRVLLSLSDPEPLFRHAEGISRSLRESEANSPVRNPFRSGYFKSGCEQQPSPNARETRPPDLNHEGASIALYAGISRGGPGRAVAACLSVLTAGSPGRPRRSTGWVESLSGSLHRRVPG